MEAYSIDNPGGSSRHIFVASFALLLSVAAHIAAFYYLPSFNLGGKHEWTESDVYRSVQLGKVLPENKSVKMETPRTLQEQLEGKSALDFKESVDSFSEAIAPVLSALDQDTFKSLASVDEASVTAEMSPLNEAPVIRQEILAIDEPLFDEQEGLLPREIIHDIDRMPIAPDIAAPLEVNEAALAALRRAPDLSFDDDILGGAGGLNMFPSAGRDGSDKDELLLASAIGAETGALMDEKAEDITEIKPIDNLLGMKLWGYQDPRETDYMYFKLELFRKGLDSLPVMPKDVVFIQDCSESMSRSKLKACKKALELGLKQLGSQDRFNVMTFRDDVGFCFDRMKPVSASSISQAKLFIQELRSRGKTDVHNSLDALIRVPRSKERPLIALLLTDGRPTMGLVDSSDIIESFSQLNNGDVSLFAIGGGERANRYLLDLMSYRNRGDSLLVPNDEEIPAALEHLSGQLKRPVMTGLSCLFSNAAELNVYPRSLTNLYLDRPLTLFGRVRSSEGQLALQVLGSAKGQEHDMVYGLDFGELLSGDESIRNGWARHKMYQLIGELSGLGVEDKGKSLELKQLSQQFGLRVPYVYDVNEPIPVR